MPSHEAVIAYIEKLPNNVRFLELEPEKQEAYIFDAGETINAHFNGADLTLTNRIVALQTLYMVDGDLDEYTHLKAHGVDSYKVKDVTVSFRDGAENLHPAVHALVVDYNPHLKSAKRVGRLI